MATAQMQLLKTRLPMWMQDWLEVIIPGAQILLIVLVAWLLQRTLRRIVSRASAHYQLPAELVNPIKGTIRARRAKACAVLRRLANAISCSRSVALNTNGVFGLALMATSSCNDPTRMIAIRENNSMNF